MVCLSAAPLLTSATHSCQSLSACAAHRMCPINQALMRREGETVDWTSDDRAANDLLLAAHRLGTSRPPAPHFFVLKCCCCLFLSRWLFLSRCARVRPDAQARTHVQSARRVMRPCARDAGLRRDWRGVLQVLLCVAQASARDAPVLCRARPNRIEPYRIGSNRICSYRVGPPIQIRRVAEPEGSNQKVLFQPRDRR